MFTDAANESDCQIFDKNITVISLNSTLDEGEIVEVENDLDTIFEVKFKNLEHYNKLGDVLLNAIKTALNISFGLNTYKENINEKNEVPKFEFYAAVADVGTKCNNTIKKAVSAAVENYCKQQKSTNTVEQIEDKATTSTDKHGINKEPSPDYSGIDLLFQIDTNPASKQDAATIPSYKRTIKEVLNDEKSREEKRKKLEEECLRGSRPKSNCFNCDSNEHGLRDCPKPRNMNRINRAKKERLMRQERYHVDAEQRFAHLKPGQISSNLRKAMGIGKNELPFFYYRMRNYGYPPGWLEDAKVANSGLSLFDEEGTIEDANADCQQHKFNVTKIIDFPGFNYDPGKNYYDDHQFHMVPPMSKHQMKEQFIKSLGDNVIRGYKRKKLKINSTTNVQNSTTNDNIEMFDMELDDDKEDITNVVPSTSTNLPNPTKIPTPPLAEIENPNLTNPPPSPTLDDLEKQHILLLKQLEQSTTICTDDSLIDEVLELEQKSIVTTMTMTTTTPTPTPTQTPTQTPTPTTPIAIPNKRNQINDSIKASYEGTPILQFSPYDRLPNSEKFQEGVSDVINFENLPDSTGKYEHMKKVLSRVRKTYNELNKE